MTHLRSPGVDEHDELDRARERRRRHRSIETEVQLDQDHTEGAANGGVGHDGNRHCREPKASHEQTLRNDPHERDGHEESEQHDGQRRLEVKVMLEEVGEVAAMARKHSAPPASAHCSGRRIDVVLAHSSSREAVDATACVTAACRAAAASVTIVVRAMSEPSAPYTEGPSMRLMSAW